jgi:hypothetical protein
VIEQAMGERRALGHWHVVASAMGMPANMYGIDCDQAADQAPIGVSDDRPSNRPVRR